MPRSSVPNPTRPTSAVSRAASDEFPADTRRPAAAAVSSPARAAAVAARPNAGPTGVTCAALSPTVADLVAGAVVHAVLTATERTAFPRPVAVTRTERGRPARAVPDAVAGTGCPRTIDPTEERRPHRRTQRHRPCISQEALSRHEIRCSNGSAVDELRWVKGLTYCHGVFRLLSREVGNASRSAQPQVRGRAIPQSDSDAREYRERSIRAGRSTRG